MLARDDEGNWLLEVSAGDEDHPAGGGNGAGWEYVQMPLKQDFAALLIRALGGENVGVVDERGR